MNTYLTISDQATISAFRLPTPASLTGHVPVCEPAVAHPAQMIMNPISWLSAGVMPVRTGATQQQQGGRLAGFGGADVTDTKFSTRVGPPSCSPPV